MQLDLIILAKIKEMTCYCESFGYGGKMLSTLFLTCLTQVSIPAEDGSQQSAIFTHDVKGSSTFVPTHAPSRPALSYPLQVLQVSTNNQNLIDNKEVYTTLISLLRTQTTKIIFINKKIRLTHQNHNIPSSKQFRSCIKEQLS
jgi:hypothetical protein